MKLHHLIAPVLFSTLMVVSATGHCSTGMDNNVTGADGNIDLHEGSAIIHATNHPDARITSGGDLSINGKSVALTANQRMLTSQYYADVYKIRAEGIAIEQAGQNLANHVMGTVVWELIKGTPDKIDSAVDAQAGKVTAKAALICTDLDLLRATQDAIANQVAVFRPYATIDADKIAQCKHSLDEANRSLATH